MPHLARRPWVPGHCETRVQDIAARVAGETAGQTDARIGELIKRNRAIHDEQCFNLNPAANVMNPRAEAALSSGLGSRPSLGYPGDKYETGLEAIEEIEVIAAELAARVFGARYAEIRVGSGALANLYGFMALAEAGDRIIAPPAAIGGHVTHHQDGCAGLYGLITLPAPVGSDGYTVDLDGLRDLARARRPRVIRTAARRFGPEPTDRYRPSGCCRHHRTTTRRCHPSCCRRSSRHRRRSCPRRSSCRHPDCG